MSRSPQHGVALCAGKASARLRCAGRNGPDLLPSWPPSSSRPRWSGEPSCAAPSRCGGLERGTTPSLPEPPVVQRRSQPGKIPSWPPRSSSDILEHVSECITACCSLTETQLRDLAPQPSALTWAAAQSGGRARRGHGAPGLGPGQGPGGTTAQPRASSTPRACAGLLGPPVLLGDSTCLATAGRLCPHAHARVTGDVAFQDPGAPSAKPQGLR